MIDTYALQKSNRELQNRIETLERRNSSFEAREVKLEKELKELKDENAVLRQNRASLVDKSTADGSLSESRAKALQEDNVRHSNWRKVKADSRLA
jgi:predicted  nucleic acid-binding Zn-ribbon protein